MLKTHDPHFAERVRASFAKQHAMALIRASLPVVDAGRTEIHLPHWDGVEQQHGFVHGGVVGMIADSAAGYAAMTLISATDSVLTVEYKMNLVAPANGEKETLCALMQQTIMVMQGKSEKQDRVA
jgi:acyl-coenzyme A thioesterase PaaI-like protein